MEPKLAAHTPNPRLAELLRQHPLVRSVAHGDGADLSFSEGAWKRQLWQGRYDLDLVGLVEMMDNNPIVCGDALSVPSPAGTLALICLGPLARAGLLVEPPALMLSFDATEDEVDEALRSEGYEEGATVIAQPQDLGTVLAATALAKVQTPDDLSEFDGLYEEAFGRSFFVRSDDAADWDTKLVAGQPFALYRLAITPDEPHSLLRIQAMADRHGKCGEAQIIHAFNVMIGCEETLGIG